jgi:DNA polymerase-3 subunit beta
MNLTIERAPALSALARVVGVVERRHTILILGNVALSAEAGALHMRATDLDMEAIETVEANVEDFGEITVPADKLHDIVRNAEAGAQISMAMNGDATRVVVKSGRSRFNLPALDAKGFPTFAAADLAGGFTMNAKVLADMLTRVSWAIAQNSPVSPLGQIYLCTTETEIHAVACSSQGIALRREPKPEGADIKAIMPPKFVAQVIKWLSEAEGDARIACSGPLIRIEHAGAILTSKLFDVPQYAPYLDALLETHQAVAVTDQDALSAALRRVLVMADAKVRSVRLSFTEGGLTIQARNDQAGEGTDEIACDYTGPDFDFLLTASRISDTLSSLRGDRVDIAFSLDHEQCVKGEDHHKVVIKAPSDPGFVSISMQPRA